MVVSEFFCLECNGYNTVELREELNGLHTIICGKCKHKHFRCITEGKLSDIRFDEGAIKKYKLNVFSYEGKWRRDKWEKDPYLSEIWARSIVN